MIVLLLPTIAAAEMVAPAQAWPSLAMLVGIALLIVCLLIWWVIGSGPKRARGYRRGQRLVRQGHWAEALCIVQELQRNGRLNAHWQGRLRHAEGECHRSAGVQAVQAKEFEKGLQHHLRAAELLNINPNEVRGSVVEKMLAELRARFASTSGADTESVHTLASRILAIQSPFLSSEVSFWEGLCHIREGKLDLAERALLVARDGDAPEPVPASGSPAPAKGERKAGDSAGFVDPPLYLGGLLLRLGRPKDALRYLTEANRLEGNCPLVSLQLGIAMVASGADGQLASRALNRGLGERGLPMWIKEPEKAWIDGMPENRSYIRKLAAKHTFVCPLSGNDLRVMVRQGQLALGQALFRMEQYQTAAETFQRLLDESAPTHDVLRWLGLSLTRLERHQEAFKHLRTALEMEDPKDRMTAGYLAMCAACAKPDKPEDKGPNVAWAVRTVRQYVGFGDHEWVWIVMQVFEEALKLNMALSGDDLVFLCDHLLSVQSAEREAAGAYYQLAVDYPELVKPPYAWLYCQAALKHNVDHDRSLELFARTFQTAADARTYFASQGWNFEELEYGFLKQAAIKAPGAFPAALGEDYPPRGETMLLERSQRQEKANDADAALASADVLLRLAPRSPAAHDRLAFLWHRRGKPERAAELLRNWCSVQPDNPVPWTRLAVIQHQQEQLEQSIQSMREAIQRANGKVRADLECLAARMLLTRSKIGEPQDATVDRSLVEQAQVLLQQGLVDDPRHVDGLWLTAATCAVIGDRDGLARQSAAMDETHSADPQFHYFAALSHLAAGRPNEAHAAAERAMMAPAFKIEAAYLSGWASIHRHVPDGAVAAMRIVAAAQESPSCLHARAVLGGIRFHQGATEEAIQCWQGLDGPRRAAWQLVEPLQKSLYLAGLQALRGEQYEQAADRFREAGKAGLRERSLGGLIQHALVKAGKRVLNRESGVGDWESAARLLEQALQIGPVDQQIAYLLALARKRQGKTGEARNALRKIANPDANVVLQMGLLSFQENQFAQAEQEFARAWQLDNACYAAGYNLLLTQLCQGKVEACAPLVGQLKSLASDERERQFLTFLEPLLQRCKETTIGKPPPLPTDKPNGMPGHDALAAMSGADEGRLLQMLMGLGQVEAIFPLLRGLAAARPGSRSAQEAFATAVLLQARKHVQRCHWDAAERLLSPLAASFTGNNSAFQNGSPNFLVATYNLLGCCQCMLQEFDRGIECFSWATKLSPSDPWLHQNLALAWELKGQIDLADGHWNRYFELQERVPTPALASYRDNLAYEGLNRLADAFSKKERWNTALTYLQRACRIRPGDFDSLERLFHMYNQVKRPEDARRTLKRLRELRPGDPQLDLHELDMREIKTLDDMERMLSDIRKVLAKYPHDARVEDKSVSMVANVIPLIGRMCDQYTDQLSRVLEQVRRLPNHQINWSAVDDAMRDLQREFQKLRRITNKCMSLVTTEEHRRSIRELLEHIDRKIEMCQGRGR